MRYVSGGATLDRDSFDALDSPPDGRTLQRAIVLHELGHVVGLGHVDDPRQLMYADNVGQLDFAEGDRAGLAKLGGGRCF
jgi:predicted Zn-dependent protease